MVGVILQESHVPDLQAELASLLLSEGAGSPAGSAFSSNGYVSESILLPRGPHPSKKVRTSAAKCGLDMSRSRLDMSKNQVIQVDICIPWPGFVQGISGDEWGATALHRAVQRGQLVQFPAEVSACGLWMFTMDENPMKLDDLEVPPILGNHHLVS